MRILFAGTPENAVPTLEKLINSEHEVVGVLTRPACPKGRGRKPAESPISLKAQEYNIPILTPKTLKDEKVQEQIRQLNCDIVVVVAYGILIPKTALEIPEYGWINLHFSLLPRWRGAAPVQYAIMNGDKKTGACVFQLEEGLDTGPIYTQNETTIGVKTSSQLLEELGQSGAELVIQALEKITKNEQPEKQENTGITLAPKFPSSIGEIDFNKFAEEIECLIRAVTDQPGAYSYIDDKRIKIAPVTIEEEDDLEAGQIKIAKKKVTVGTGTKNICLTRIAPSGKSWMNATDWGRGVRGEKSFTSPQAS